MGRAPQKISKIPNKLNKPLELKDAVAGGVRSRLAGICFNEITALFVCLKRSGFNEEPCQPEITNFQKCYYLHFNRKFSKEPSRKKATPEEVNKLLKKFPDIKER